MNTALRGTSINMRMPVLVLSYYSSQLNVGVRKHCCSTVPPFFEAKPILQMNSRKRNYSEEEKKQLVEYEANKKINCSVLGWVPAH